MVTLSVEVTSKSSLHVCNICTPAVSASLHPCVCKHKQVRISYGPRNPSNPDNSQSLRLYCTLHNIKEGRGRREQALDHLRDKHLTTYVIGIVIGGENIDWQLPSSVQTVCELLGVKKTTVYKYRKQIDIKYVQPKRQTRSDALDSQPWYYWIPFGNWTVTKAQTQTIRLKSMTLVVQIITDMIPCLTTQEKRIEYA